MAGDRAGDGDPRGSIQFDLLRLLRRAGYPVKRVIRVDSPGDAGSAFTEVLFITADNRPHRAYIKDAKRPLIWTVEGWALADGYEAPS